MGDIGKTIERREYTGRPEDAPAQQPQPEPAAPEREAVPA